jgi:hypothetical protein
VAGDKRYEAKRAVGGVRPVAMPRDVAGLFQWNRDEPARARTQSRISHQHVTDRRATENDGRLCPMSCNVRYVEEVVIVAMTNKNYGSVIGRSRKQSLYLCRIGGDPRAASQPSKGAWPRDWERGIAEERVRKEGMPTSLDEDARNTQVGDGYQIARISTVPGCAADGMWARCDLMRDNRWASTAHDDKQCARKRD